MLGVPSGHLQSSQLRSKVPAGSAIWLLARSNSHSVVARSDCTTIPLAAGRLERTRPFFVTAFEAMQSIGSSTRIDRG